MATFMILLLMLSGCGLSKAPSITKTSTKLSDPRMVSCVGKDPDRVNEMCYMVDQIPTGYDFEFICNNINSGQVEGKACDTSKFARTCETTVIFSREADNSRANITYKYFYTPDSKTRCLGEEKWLATTSNQATE